MIEAHGGIGQRVRLAHLHSSVHDEEAVVVRCTAFGNEWRHLRGGLPVCRVLTIAGVVVLAVQRVVAEYVAAALLGWHAAVLRDRLHGGQAEHKVAKRESAVEMGIERRKVLAQLLVRRIVVVVVMTEMMRMRMRMRMMLRCVAREDQMSERLSEARCAHELARIRVAKEELEQFALHYFVSVG